MITHARHPRQCALVALLICVAARGAENDAGSVVHRLVERAEAGFDWLGEVSTEWFGPRIVESDSPLPYSVSDEFAERYPLGPSPVICISNEFGRVVVRVWEEPVVEIRAAITYSAAEPDGISGAALANLFQASVSGSGIEIGASASERPPHDRASVVIDYELAVPAGASLEIENAFGDVEIGPGLAGDVYLDVSHGAASIHGLEGVLSARLIGSEPLTAVNVSGGGSVALQGVPADFEGLSGKWRIDGFVSNLRFSGLHEDVDLLATLGNSAAVIETAGSYPTVEANIWRGSFSSELEAEQSAHGAHQIAEVAGTHSGHATFVGHNASVAVVRAGMPPTGQEAPGDRFQETEDEQIALAEGVTVVVGSDVGDVVITGVDEPIVSITAVRSVWGESVSQVPEALKTLRFSAEQRGNQLRVSASNGAGDGASAGAEMRRLDLQIRCPRNAPVQTRVGRGELRVEGMKAGLLVSQVGGRAQVRRCDGPLRVNGTEAAIALAECSGPVSVESSGGRLILERIAGAIDIHGDDTRTAIEDPGASVLAVQKAGDVRLLALEALRGNIEIRLERGNVAALIPPECDATLTLTALRGRIDSAIPVTGNLSRAEQEFHGRLGNGAHSVLLSTEDGDITLN